MSRLRSCSTCHWAGLPRRQVCPRCGDGWWLGVHSVAGTVTATTRVWRNFGSAVADGEALLTVHLDQGGTVIARAAGRAELPVGSQVTVNSSLRASHR